MASGNRRFREGSPRPGHPLSLGILPRPVASNLWNWQTVSPSQRQTMSIPDAGSHRLDFFGSPLVVEPSPGQLSSDAGLLPIRPFDQQIRFTLAFANALDDPRDPDLTEHSFLEMVRSRIYGILAGYEDQNDHDT